MSEWAGGGTWATVWRAMRQPTRPPMGQINTMLAHQLARAHVVTFPHGQIEVLPRPADIGDDPGRPPFDTTFLSFGTNGAAPYEGRYLGALLTQPMDIDSSGIWFQEHAEGQFSVFVFTHMATDPPSIQNYPVGWATIDPEQNPAVTSFATIADLMYEWGDKTAEEHRATCISVFGRGLATTSACLEFLQSANVDLVEAPVSRQERRAAERTGGRVALTVQVRQQRRQARTATHGPAREFSHRFEVRGHYKHFPATTRLAKARPDKLVNIPDRGPCRRIWCPPFVKGPDDKPLVPKVRVVEERTAA